MDGWDPIVDITAFNADRFNRTEQADTCRRKKEKKIEINNYREKNRKDSNKTKKLNQIINCKHKVNF